MVQKRKSRIIKICLILSSIIFSMLWNTKLVVQATGGTLSGNTYKVEETRIIEIDGIGVYLSGYHKDHWFAREKVVCVQSWDVVLTSEEVTHALDEGTLGEIIKEKSELELLNLYDRTLIEDEHIWIDYEEVLPYENLEGYESIVYINMEEEYETISKECLVILVKVVGNPQELPQIEQPKEPELPREPAIYNPPPMMNGGYWGAPYNPPYVPPYNPPYIPPQEPREIEVPGPEELNIVESRDYLEYPIIEPEEMEEIEEVETIREVEEEKMTPVRAAVIATEGTSSLLLGLSIFSDLRLLKWCRRK